MNDLNFDNVTMVSPMEGETLPQMCEIRFDCLVTAYDIGTRTHKVPTILPFMYTEKPGRPQWFKNHIKIDLNTIKHGDPYAIGIMIKNMYRQLELHIEKYENKK